MHISFGTVVCVGFVLPRLKLFQDTSVPVSQQSTPATEAADGEEGDGLTLPQEPGQCKPWKKSRSWR